MCDADFESDLVFVKRYSRKGVLQLDCGPVQVFVSLKLFY